MDNGLPESVGELLAHQEFYQLIEAQCNMLRTGPKVKLSPVASHELQHVRERLRKIKMKLARLKKKGKAA